MKITRTLTWARLLRLVGVDLMLIARSVLLMLLGIAMMASPLAANDKYSGSPVARLEFDKGKVASQSEDWKTAVAAYKKAIQLDPNFADAHKAYISARRQFAEGNTNGWASKSAAERHEISERADREGDRVKNEYQELLRRHPDMPIYHWALAQTYERFAPILEAEKYCAEAVQMDPAFSPGYDCIASLATRRGDTDAAVKALRKEIDLNPDKTELLVSLQWIVRSDSLQFEKVTREIVNKFPGSEAAAEALDTYAEFLPQAEQIPKLEEIVANYSPSKFFWAMDAANHLFGLYDSTDPNKANDFSHKMLGEMPNDKEWKDKAGYAENMAAAEAKIAAKDGNAAVALLKDVKDPDYPVDPTRFHLLKAKAQDLAGNAAAAYADLLKVFADRPVHEVQPVLYQYGKKLGKSESTVDEEVWEARSASAKPASPFSLESFIDGKKVSLDDYKGKVVLLDFWYPTCSPCLAAMPYLQALWTKYQDSGLVFLGVNGLEEEGDFVMPLVKSKRWGMVPLKSTDTWCRDTYKVLGYPSTFLIGTDGRVYFRPNFFDAHDYETGEMEVEALLAAARADKNR